MLDSQDFGGNGIFGPIFDAYSSSDTFDVGQHTATWIAGLKYTFTQKIGHRGMDVTFVSSI